MVFARVIVLLFLACAASAQPSNPPTGLVYTVLPDPYISRPAFKPNYTAPDIPVTYLAQPEGSNLPEQVQLTAAVKDVSRVFVTWITPDKLRSPLGAVRYGFNLANLKYTSSCTGKRYTYGAGTDGSYTSGAIYNCVLGPLVPSKSYTYKIVGDVRSYVFKSLPAPGPKHKIRIGLIADVGQTLNSSTTLDHVAAAPLDYVLFAADLNYADNYNYPCHPFAGVDLPLGTPGGPTCGIGGMRWDSWGRLYSKVSSHVPTAFIPGNHENEFSPRFGEITPFKAYQARTPSTLDNTSPFEEFASYVTDLTKLPFKGFPSKSPNFYSLDIGPLHLVALSSYEGFVKYSHQYYWLQDDLCSISRDVTPWVVTMMHAPWYNSDSSHYIEGEYMRQIYEPWLYNATVDVVFAGHVHAYERSKPSYALLPDACGPIYVTVGDGGNDEGVAGPFVEPQPIYSAYREYSFGHAELDIQSPTKAVYTWYRNQDDLRVVGDQFALTNKHFLCGPKKPSFCPK